MSATGRQERADIPMAGRRMRLALSVQYAAKGDDLPARPLLRRWVAAALDADASVTVRFVEAREGRTLNRTYRGKDAATNVLAFVYDGVSGRRHRAVRASAQTRSAATGQDIGRALRAPRRSRHAALAGIRSPSVGRGNAHGSARDRHPRQARSRRSLRRATSAPSPMSSDSPERETLKPTLLERLSAFLTREPEDREGLLEILHGAFEHKLLDADALSIIEGRSRFRNDRARHQRFRARRWMSCRSTTILLNSSPSCWRPAIALPAIGENKDDVVGILLARSC